MKFLKNILICLVVAASLMPAFGMAMDEGEMLLPAAPVRMASEQDQMAITMLESREAHARHQAERERVSNFPGRGQRLDHDPIAVAPQVYPIPSAPPENVYRPGNEYQDQEVHIDRDEVRSPIIYFDVPATSRVHVAPQPVAASVTNWFKRHVNWQRMVVVATVAALATWWFWKK